MRLYFAFIFITSIIIAQEESYNNIHSLTINDSIKSLKIDSLLCKRINDQEYLATDIIGNKYANWHFRKKRVSKAIEALLISITYNQRGDTSLQQKYHKLGQFYNAIKIRDKSIEAYKEAISINANPIRTARVYSLLGFSYYENGDYYNSQQYFEVAEKKFREEKDVQRLIINHINSSNTYSRINTQKASNKLIKNLLEADSLTKSINVPTTRTLKIKKALLSYYVDYKTRDIKSGEKYGSEALVIANQLQDSLGISETYNLLGNLYDHSNPTNTIQYNKKALRFNTQSEYIQSISYASLGLSNSKLKNYDQSISHFHKSLALLTGFDFRSKAPEIIEKTLNTYFDNDNLWVIINNLAEAYLLQYENTNNPISLEKSIHFFLIADTIIDLYNKNTDETQTKLIWRRKATELYGRALKAAFLSKRIDVGHFLQEKNKALLLYEENSKQQQLQNIKLSRDILHRKLQLQKIIIELERTNSSTNNISESLLKNKQALNQLLDSIQKIYPGYNNIKKTYIPKSINEIQASLDTNEIILEYHVNIDEGYGVYPNKNKVYLICISREKAYFFEINDVKKLIKQLYQKQLKPFRTDNDILDYHSLSLKAYDKLFPIEIREVIANKNLTIIPDNYLSKIPFESLIVSKTKQRDYLINYHQISYKYSNTFHDQNKNNIVLSNQNFAAFAPVYFNDPELDELTESMAEVDILKQYFKGQIFLEEKATKKSFTDILGNANIIHLATHADANDSIAPWIAFSKQKMYLDELSLSPNNASLVVLSACKTTDGKIETGEGVMSLARGFFYGGAQSTVSSLWNVDDKSSQLILRDFYKNLDLGISKSQSLHTAKINYLKNHVGSEASPYYWASLILIGDTSPLPKNNWATPFLIISILSAVILIILIIFLLRTHIHKKNA
ncbi:CHAT domain-containing protein [uncultured Aquimarina sp.]|uniref:CHAT domain-containing protein n=1 Tax=uncultured Aquimarina sp. TaxID=575652 RepID=UPI002629F3F0|nr:CHAT domain-containing protein [uncultured Aquimarina sp.]